MTTRDHKRRGDSAVGMPGRVAVTVVLAVSALATAPAQADPDDSFTFQTPSGNIACTLGPAASGGTDGSVVCEIGVHTYDPPTRPQGCHLGWGDRFGLSQGAAPYLSCHGDTIRSSTLKILDYDVTAFSGAIRCGIERTGVTCTDTSTDHRFRVAREAYEIN